MKEVMKLNLMDCGVPGFVLKNKRIFEGTELVGKDENGKDVYRNVYRYEFDEKYCRERYKSMVNSLPQFGGILVIYAENGSKREIMEVVNCKGELKDSFRKCMKKGMGRYEWMIKELREGKFKKSDLELRIKKIDFKLGVQG